MDGLALSEGGGVWGVGCGAGPMVEYVADVARPVGGASDGVWLTGRIGALSAVESNPHPGPLPQGEGGQSGWRVVVVGALLVGGLWGVAVAWTLLALVRAM